MAMPTKFTITMTDTSLIKLMTWLSPAFPIGGFSWSNGLESACQNGSINDSADLNRWITTSLEFGPAHNDLIVLAATHRGNTSINEINDLALALAGSAERFQETTELGAAFLKAANAWTPDSNKLSNKHIAYPIAVGWVAAHNNIALKDTLLAFLQSIVSNQIQVALRLMSLGQQAGIELLASLEPTLVKHATAAANSTLEDVGTCGLHMDIASMQHETLHSRIFRS